MPPHIYSVAQTILARMEGLFLARTGGLPPDTANVDCSTIVTNRNHVSTASLAASTIKVPTQAVCLLGRSGSGKSVNTEYLVEYLLSQHPSDSILTGAPPTFFIPLPCAPLALTFNQQCSDT